MQQIVKRYLAPALFLVSAFGSQAALAELSLTFTDASWTGTGIPEAQMCQKFGGKDPQSPELVVKGIPAEATAVILYFSDRNFPRMDKGGHGTVGYKIAAGTTEVTVPRIPGHTETLTGDLFMVAAHLAPTWDKPGAYLPPCSGGRGNKYFIDVKAVKLGADNAIAEVLAEASIPLAVF